jgi:glycosyltransferase involved in cell wall biosynthesis
MQSGVKRSPLSHGEDRAGDSEGDDVRVPVEFAGWLPVYEWSGNCGRHPQFTHTQTPPPGYRFTHSAPPPAGRPPLWDRTVGRLWERVRRAGQALGRLLRPLVAVFRADPGVPARARLRVLAAVVRLFFVLLRGGGRVGPVLRFLRSRHFQSQVLLGDYRGLVFLTSMPYTYGQNPWVVEIEDPTTLFYPLIQNGATRQQNLADSPYFPIVKTLLETERCKGIFTHMRSTAALVPRLFGSATIARKVFYTPLGVSVPGRWQRHDEDDPEEIHLLFINSWCQVPANFFVRGGLDVLEAFATLRERYPQLRLTLRTELPALGPRYHRIMEQGWVRVINRFLPADEMAALHADSHVFLLPAARVHIVSLLQAMSHGLAVVASDGWGMEEYLTHERNGLVVRGRYGRTSWADERAGMLREDYEPMFTSDPEVVRGLVEAVSRLVEDPQLRRRLGRTARRDVETTYNLQRWNAGLKEALDRALSPQP